MLHICVYLQRNRQRKETDWTVSGVILRTTAEKMTDNQDWYEDDGFTGSNMNRPGLQRLINDCTRKRVKCVVAFKLDRLSRSMVDGIYLIERIFIPNGVEFKCVHDSVSYDSPMEQAYTQMMAVFAQLDKTQCCLECEAECWNV